MTNFEARIKVLEHENQELRNRLAQVLGICEELREENKRLKTRVNELETELEKYKVKPNEPPGSKPDFLKENNKKSKPKPPGQKPGHKGTSRMSPSKIDKHNHYVPKACEHCERVHLDQVGRTRSKVITDIEFKVVNIKEHYYDMKCHSCGHVTKPKSVHGKSKSPFGRGFQTLISYLRDVGGMTIRPIEDLFRDFFKFDVSDSSISNCEIRISEESLDEYNNYLELVKQSPFSHKDETSYRINGSNHWIWTYDSIDSVYYRLDPTRSMSVVNTDFKDKMDQISINDCYGGYNRFVNQQICWAHLLRETHEHAKKDNACRNEKKFHNQLKELYRRACEVTIGDPPIEKRQEERVKLENDLVNIMISIKKKSSFLERIFSRLNDRLASCFLFVEVEGLPSTNNQAERSLRPFVIHRKASFGSKSFAGGLAKVSLKTLYENTKRQGLQAFHALDHLFEKQEFVDIKTT